MRPCFQEARKWKWVKECGQGFPFWQNHKFKLKSIWRKELRMVSKVADEMLISEEKNWKLFWHEESHTKISVPQCVFIDFIRSRTIHDWEYRWCHQIYLKKLQDKIRVIKVEDWQYLFQSGLHLPKPDPVQPRIRLAHEDVGETTFNPKSFWQDEVSWFFAIWGKPGPRTRTLQKWVICEFSRDHVGLKIWIVCYWVLGGALIFYKNTTTYFLGAIGGTLPFVFYNHIAYNFPEVKCRLLFRSYFLNISCNTLAYQLPKSNTRFDIMSLGFHFS